MKKLTRRKSHIEDALKRLDKLTREEARMSTSQVINAIIKSMDEPEDTNESVPELVYGMQTSVNREKQSNTTQMERTQK